MSHSRHSRAPRRRGRPLSAEEKLLRRARVRANHRIALATHQIAYVSTLLLIYVTTRSTRVVLIVAAAWGIGLAIHHFVALWVPRLRQRWISEEVGRERETGVVVEQRREIEHRHVRSLEDLSAEVAHEIRNPIAAAKSLVQQMGEDPKAAHNIEFAGVALQELDRVERSISHLLKYAREEELQLETLVLGDVLESALETFRDRLQRMGVSVEREIGGSGVMRGDAEKLRRVMINLIGNALDAMEQAEVVEPRLRVLSGENLAGDRLWVRIADNGPGIDAETRERMFSPFYTTKASGTGLGLALARKIIDAHGGAISVESEAASGAAGAAGAAEMAYGGSEFIVELPAGGGVRNDA